MAEEAMSVDPLCEARTWRSYYTEAELRHGVRIKRISLAGVPFFVGWYFLIAYVMKLMMSAFGQGSEHLAMAVAPVIWVLQVLLAVVGVGAFCLQSCLLPPNKDTDIYHAQKYLGGWVFLTRHCLTLQAVHLVVSLLASILPGSFPALGAITNCISLWVGSLGCFVTVQYFTLVHFNPVFVASCNERINRDPPDNLRRKCFLVHIFALPLALVDIAVCRNHELLQKDSSLGVSFLMIVMYVLFYLSVIVVNFRITGHWPYDVLKGFKTLFAWAGFVLVQAAIMCIFCAVLWGLSFLPSAC